MRRRREIEIHGGLFWFIWARPFFTSISSLDGLCRRLDRMTDVVSPRNPTANATIERISIRERW